MIRLTRLNHAPLVLNCDLIEHIDVTPDTVITLTTGQILRVRETPEQVIERIVDFRRRIFAGADQAGGDPGPASEPVAWGADLPDEESLAAGDTESPECPESPDRPA
jgi:flagellar protein FlbD